MAETFIKDENGIVALVSTSNLQLEKPLVSENYNIDVHNRNMEKIDNAVTELKGTVNGLGAKNIQIADETNVFAATNVEDALLENKNEITSNKKEIENLKQSGVDIKTNMVQAINSKKTVPDVTNSDTWPTLTQRVKDIKEGSGNAQRQDVLVGKTFTNNDGIEYVGSMPNNPATTNALSVDSVESSVLVRFQPGAYLNPGFSEAKVSQSQLEYINYIKNGRKWSTGNPNSNEVRGLSFRPSFIIGKTDIGVFYTYDSNLNTMFYCSPSGSSANTGTAIIYNDGFKVDGVYSIGTTNYYIAFA